MSSKGLVLVTGANGFIAARTVEAFLNAGYSVRGTVRSKAKSIGLLAALPDAVSSGKFELVEIPDITAPGAFDEAVKGVTAIAHLASPVSFFFTDPDYVVGTAVNGVKSVLQSAIKEPSIENFVLMSSVVAISGDKPVDYVFTEADWNDRAPAVLAELGNKAPGPVIYSASKIAAEKEFWKFQQEHKPTFTMTTVNPAFVAGAPLVLPDSPEEINETTIFIWKIQSGQEIPEDLGGFAAFVDVRDVARLVVFGVDESAKANNQRYLAYSGWGGTQAAADVLRRAYPDRRNVIKEGHPGQGYLPDWSWPEAAPKFDSSKAVKATGREWISFDAMVLDAAKAFEKYL